MLDGGTLGEICMFAGDFAPSGWAFCDGQSLSVEKYQALYSIIGNTYGGNRTTFKLPDLTGRFATGAGRNGSRPVKLGETGGHDSVNLTTSQMPAHQHSLNSNVTLSVPIAIPVATSSTGGTLDPGANSVLGPLTGVTHGSLYSPGTETTTTLQSFNAKGSLSAANDAFAVVGNGAAVSVRNPYLGVTFIICIEGLFPTR